jgi:phosphotransferase system enzyme I (PtsI)
MNKFRGIGLSPGIAIGRSLTLIPTTLELPCRSVTDGEVEGEMKRFKEAVSVSVSDIGHVLDGMTENRPERDILEAEQMILQDPELASEVQKIIAERLICAESAVQEIFARLVEHFRSTGDDYFAQRASDYREAGHRLVHQLLGGEDEYPTELEPDTVLVMEEVPAVLVMRYADKGLIGIVAERGGRTGHTAIVARALGIPYITGIPGVIREIQSGKPVVMDGDVGECVMEPDDSAMSFYKVLRNQFDQRLGSLEKLINLETSTRDGVRIHLRCNLGFPSEIEHVQRYKAEGIGLFRTEFLFMNRDTAPDEEEQYEIYRSVALGASPNEVIIRTIDVGGDKFASILNLDNEANPALGLRGIRISLKFPELFRTQVRAILRAAVHGHINIMFPMVTSLEEVRRARKLIADCKLELRNEGIPFKAEVPTGIMIEVPSAALMSDSLAAEVDFFSIGTNDLVQYTLAIDRSSENIPEVYNPFHPAVLQLVTLVVQNARKHNIPVSVCGELAADRDFIPFLIGLGIPELSVSPGDYLQTKEWIMNLNSQYLVDLVLDLLDQTTAHAVHEIIERWRKKHGLAV